MEENKIHILVVEDDKEINWIVANYLSKEGYITDRALDGLEALKYLSSREYQLVILDLMIPGVDGYEVLRRIREKGSTPVIILSAKHEEYDKIIGLGLGADDYMTKPFGIAELIARARAQLRRYLFFQKSESSSPCMLKHLDIEMDLNAHTVVISGCSILLTAKEFEILKLFMTNPRKVFTKNQIFSSVWNEDYMGDENTVMVHIRRLREKIEKDPSNPRYIQTVWGIGYKLGEV